MKIWKYIDLFFLAIGIAMIIIAIVTRQYYFIVTGLLIAGVSLRMFFKAKEKEHNAKKRTEQTNDDR